MNLLELDYKVFTYLSKRTVEDTEKIKNYFIEKKNDIVNLFNSVYKINQVYDFGIEHFNSFNNNIIKLTNNKELVTIENKDKENAVLRLFEMIVNTRELSTDEIEKITNLYFYKDSDILYFYKDIKVIEGQLIKETLTKAFDYHKNENNNDIQTKFDEFTKISKYIDKEYIICRKCTDVLDRIHYETLVNPKVAIDQSKIADINKNLKIIDDLFNY